jgi:hypothetical protein
MKRKFIANKRAMSIVISTVIIIAISITMAIAVAFWAMGVGNSFTRFEKLEFVSIYVDTATNQATAALSSVNANGGITGIVVTNVGSGYTAIPSVNIANVGNSSGATARVTGLSNGIITGITITNPIGLYYGESTNHHNYTAYNIKCAFSNLHSTKNTGSTATINNVFIDGKPFNVVEPLQFNFW